LREECGLWVFENRVLRRIFGPKRDEVTGEWRRLSKDELYSLYFSPNIIWMIRKTEMNRTCSMREGEKRCIEVLLGKLEGTNHLVDPDVERKILLKRIFEKWAGGVDWINLA
jgi:hypothetical protein